MNLEALAQGLDSASFVLSYRLDENYYANHSPIEFLNLLKNNFKNRDNLNSYTVAPSPANWVTEGHIDDLIKLMYQKDSTQSVMSTLSSYLTNDMFSSIGNEAQNLIDCFRTNHTYPISLNSSGQPDKLRAKNLKEWWTKYKRRKK
jgi:hypothetical protein